MADTESCLVVLNKGDHIKKVNAMTHEEISNRKYIEASDMTHVDLKNFPRLNRNFKDKEYYDIMHLVLYQPDCLFTTTKIDEFNTTKEINVDL